MSTEKFSFVQARHRLISLYKFLHQDNLNQGDLSNFSIGVYNLSETELNMEIDRYVKLIYHDFEEVQSLILIQDIFDIYKIIYGSRMTLDQSTRLKKLLENMTPDELVGQKQKIIERLGLNVSIDKICENLQRIFHVS